MLWEKAYLCFSLFVISQIIPSMVLFTHMALLQLVNTTTFWYTSHQPILLPLRFNNLPTWENKPLRSAVVGLTECGELDRILMCFQWAPVSVSSSSSSEEGLHEEDAFRQNKRQGSVLPSHFPSIFPVKTDTALHLCCDLHMSYKFIHIPNNNETIIPHAKLGEQQYSL